MGLKEHPIQIILWNKKQMEWKREDVFEVKLHNPLYDRDDNRLSYNFTCRGVLKFNI